MTKVSYEAVIKLLVTEDATGEPVELTAADAAGLGAGTAVAGQIAAKRDLQYMADNGSGTIATYFIPYHAIAYVAVTKTTSTVEAPEDEFCKE